MQAYRVHIRRRVVFGERLARVGEVVRSPKLCVAVDLIDSGHGTPGDRRTADHYEMSVRLRALVEGRALNE